MTSKPREWTRERFASYIESRPGRLGSWRDGADGVHPLLGWFATNSVREFKELAAEVGPSAAAAMTTSTHHNASAIAAEWASRYMVGAARRRASTEADRRSLFRTAGDYWQIQNALIEVDCGVRRYEPQGRVVRLPYCGVREIDALDRVLDMVERLSELEDLPSLYDDRLVAWLRGHGRHRSWFESPPWVQDLLRDFARNFVSRSPKHVPGRLIVEGVSMDEVNELWVELLAWGFQMHGAALNGSRDLQAIAPAVHRASLVADLSAATGLNPNHVAKVMGWLTLDDVGSRDPALTPFIPIGDSLVPISNGIMATSPQRNLLSVLQSDPDRFGAAGRELGDAGESAVMSVLARLDSRVRIDRRVKVVRDTGMPAGDFDVVAYDPVIGLAAVFEVRWGLTADGNREVYRVEADSWRKRQQVVKLRDEVVSGVATPQWPLGWDVTREVELRWFVLTRDVLTMRRVSEDGITIRSHQLLEKMLRKGSSLADLVSLLDNPPLPPAVLSETQWDRIRFGDFSVEIEHLNA